MSACRRLQKGRHSYIMAAYVSLIIVVMAAVVTADTPYDAMPSFDHLLQPVPGDGDDPYGPVGFPEGPLHPAGGCPDSCPLHWDPVLALCQRPWKGLVVFVNHCAFQREICRLHRPCVKFDPKWDPHHPEGWH